MLTQIWTFCNVAVICENRKIVPLRLVFACRMPKWHRSKFKSFQKINLFSYLSVILVEIQTKITKLILAILLN